MGRTETAASQRLPVIDVLRLCAALGVLIFHVSILAGLPKRFMPPFSLSGHTITYAPSLFTLGATGVSLFFVISGFCLYLSARRKPQPLATYAINRVARIYPAYLFAIGVSVVIGIALSQPPGLVDFLVKALFLHGFIQPYNLSINGALWSMATEAQFYVAFPVIAWAMGRMGAAWGALAALALALAFRIWVAGVPGADVIIGGLARGTFLSNLLPGRLAEFAAGMATAAFYLDHWEGLRRWAPWAALPLLAAGFAVRALGPAWLAEPLMGLGFAAGLAAAVTLTPDDAPLAMPALLGRASYSLFLIHLPILVLLMRAARLRAGGTYADFAVLFAVGAPICMVLALAMYAGVERPLWRLLSVGPVRPVPAAP